MDTFEERKALVAKLNAIDDVLFEKIAEDRETCEELLQVILSMPSLQVIKSETQKFIRNVGTKSVRLDLWCVDASGRTFNVEMQKANDDDHIRRVRYYSSNLDTLSTEQGTDYKDLPELYMIYITRKDFLHGNRTIYHVERRLAETGKLVYNGINEIYINTAVHDGSVLADLMSLMANSSYQDNRFPKLSSRIRFFKEEHEGVRIMCDLVEEYAQKVTQELKKELADKDAKLADKDAKLADKDAEIERLKKQLEELKM